MTKARDLANIAGSSTASSVAQLTDVDVATAAPTNNQVLKYNTTTSKWQPADDVSGSGGSGGGSSSFTGLTDTTLSTVDPTISSNPTSGVGHVWINSTNGKQYILTSATAGANVWFGVHSNSQEIPLLNLDYLIVGGGGSGGGQGGNSASGGGGGGEVIHGTVSFKQHIHYNIIIGAGGSAGTSNAGANGQDSQALNLTALGGGGGMHHNQVGKNGGSGGGAGGRANIAGGLSLASGFGNDGGRSAPSSSSTGADSGGGGGGAGAVGGNAGNSVGGLGGDGLSNSITGSAVYYAGGGGGGTENGGAVPSGGLGGGGNGSNSGSTPSTAGAPNSGGGGGGSGGAMANSGTAANGGSGVVVLRSLINTSTLSGSPTVTQDGAYYIYTFTGSGGITF